MALENPVTLTRDLTAIQIPDGFATELKAGSEVRITQALGGTFTVMTDIGALMRVDGKDADALGKVAGEAGGVAEMEAAKDGPTLEKQVWEVLKTCYDPEIPVNIVDLGLVYVCRVTSLEEGGHRVDINLTLTAPGCGMGNVLRTDVEEKVRALAGVREVACEIVFEPTWDRSMMSEAAKLQLGMF